MNNMLLNINGEPLYVATDRVGALSISNNKDGNRFVCLINGLTDERRELNVGDKIEVKLLSLNSTDKPAISPMPDLPNVKDCTDPSSTKTKEGMEIIIGKQVVSIPFIANGAVTALITLNRGIAFIDIGGITPDNILLDYYASELNTGDSITITLKHLNHLSEPIRKRKYTNYCASR